MPFGENAHHRIASRFRTETDPILGGQTDPFQSKPDAAEQIQGLDRGLFAGVAGGQKKNPLCVSLAQRLDGRKQDRQGLTDPGGRLNERLTAVPKGPVHRNGHLALAGAIVRVGKSQRPDGPVPQLSPGGKRRGPFQIAMDQILEERIQGIPLVDLVQLQDLPGVQLVVRQLNPDRRQRFFPGQQAGIHLGLPPMAGIGILFDQVKVPGGRFDLLDERLPFRFQHAVNAAADHQDHLRRLYLGSDPDLGPIAFRPFALNALMGTNPRERATG